jgi:hypothetical protein
MFEKKEENDFISCTRPKTRGLLKKICQRKAEDKVHFSQNPAHFIGKVEVDRRPFSLSAIHGPG